jgi:3-oxoacyl-[acyl-carrier protein] reductase
LVTGAGAADGIGFATARLLTELGADVAIAATSPRIHDRAAELGESARATGHVADLRQPDLVEGLVKAVLEQHGRLDVVVNNAGMVSVGTEGEGGSVASLSVARWRASIARNLDTAFHVVRAALPYLPDNGGRIVNVSSVTGPVMAMRREAGYAAAKAGMVGLTRSLAVDLGIRGITANAVAPGWIATGSQTDDERRQARATPMGRSATPSEVAAVIAWLCTPGAGYITGQCIVVDGGNSIAEERIWG